MKMVMVRFCSAVFYRKHETFLLKFIGVCTLQPAQARIKGCAIFEFVLCMGRFFYSCQLDGGYDSMTHDSSQRDIFNDVMQAAFDNKKKTKKSYSLLNT
jgi:hypothetical protein